MVTAAVRTHGGVHPKVKPTVPQLDIALVREKLAGQIVEMKRPEVLRSTAIKLEWDVSTPLSQIGQILYLQVL